MTRSACSVARARRPCSRGQALVEFALVLPVMMFILLIVVDFGRLYQSWIQLNNAARVGANYAAMTAQTFTSGDPQYQSLITKEMSGAGCQLATPLPSPTFSPGTVLGGTASVSLNCAFTFVTPVIGNMFSPTDKLSLGATAGFPIRTGAVYNVPGSVPVVPPP